MRFTGFAYPTTLLTLAVAIIIGDTGLIPFVAGFAWFVAIIARGIEYESDVPAPRSWVVAFGALGGLGTLLFAALVTFGGGPLAVLSSHSDYKDPAFLSKLQAKGIEKFIAYELPLEEVKERYGGHFQVVVNDLHESDDLRVLDYNGHRVFRLFNLRELGTPFVYEPAGEPSQVFMD